MKTWLFWDWWQIEHQDNAEIRQGRPRWVPEATYADPTLGYLGYWPQVWRENSGRFRMLYVGSGFPLTVFSAESLDGVKWEPSDCRAAKPVGKKLAPNHVFTVENANGGPIVRDTRDPNALRFLLCMSHRGGDRAAKAAIEENTEFHELVTTPGSKPYGGHNRMAVSADGLNWELAPDSSFFECPGWFPEPAFSPFFSHALNRYVLVSRHGWGDRRIAGCLSQDGLSWSKPFHLLQPDAEDPAQLQFYGMPVTHYEGWYVGFLWTAHFANAERLERWNQISGFVDSQLTYSPDGRAFQRFRREPFMPLNEPGEPGSAVLYPTSMVEHDDQLLIYSSASPELHHQRSNSQWNPDGDGKYHILLHTLRKDGFTYLASKGNWATIQTKPMLLNRARLEINVHGPHGEALFQLSDATSKPLQGFRYDECVPFTGGDELKFPVRWKDADLKTLVGEQAVRLEIKFRNLRIHALRGDFHFADALDLARAADKQPLEVGPFDF